METITHSTIAMLAVINPFVCGTMLLQTEQGQNKKDSIVAGVKAMLAVLVILLAAALGGHYILGAFGISMEALSLPTLVLVCLVCLRQLKVGMINREA